MGVSGLFQSIPTAASLCRHPGVDLSRRSLYPASRFPRSWEEPTGQTPKLYKTKNKTKQKQSFILNFGIQYIYAYIYFLNCFGVILAQPNSESNLHQLILSINSGEAVQKCTELQRKTRLESKCALNNAQSRKSISQ